MAWPATPTSPSHAGTRSIAGPLFDRLAPWADQVPNERHHGRSARSATILGGLATVLGRYDEAETYFTHAAEFNERADAKFFAARTNLSWGDDARRTRRSGRRRTGSRPPHQGPHRRRGPRVRQHRTTLPPKHSSSSTDRLARPAAPAGRGYAAAGSRERRPRLRHPSSTPDRRVARRRVLCVVAVRGGVGRPWHLGAKRWRRRSSVGGSPRRCRGRARQAHGGTSSCSRSRWSPPTPSDRTAAAPPSRAGATPAPGAPARPATISQSSSSRVAPNTHDRCRLAVHDSSTNRRVVGAQLPRAHDWRRNRELPYRRNPSRDV